MRAHLAGGALALALSVAACSGGDGDSESGSPPTVPAATATTRGQSSSADNERFCERLRRADELLNRARTSGTPQAVEERYNSAVEAMRGVVDSTPERLRKDAETLARGYDALVEEVRKAGWSLSRVPAGTIERLGTPDMRAAGERLETYERQVCGTAG
ncbi:MAG: hypothetical protein M3450_01555 [Actinomycetota bacterium]|nr:hypothetical protein [Actinomycetota bacterium]